MLTDLEKKVLRTFPKDQFCDNLDSEIWVNCFQDTIMDKEGINSKVSRALLSTLKQKGYIDIRAERDKRESVVWLTEKGKDWLRPFLAKYYDEE